MKPNERAWANRQRLIAQGRIVPADPNEAALARQGTVRDPNLPRNGSRQLLHAHLKKQVKAVAQDPQKVREVVLPALLPDAVAGLALALQDRRAGRITTHARWAMRQVFELARIVDVPPQVAIAVFAKFGLKDEAEVADIVGRVREAEGQPLAQTVNQAAGLIRDWVADHPEDKARLLGIAFGGREVEVEVEGA